MRVAPTRSDAGPEDAITGAGPTRVSLTACTIDELVDRVSRGDREAAALLVTRYEPMLRRRIRAQLSTTTRRLFDSQDVFSTVCRRFDRFVGDGQVRADSLGQLLSLMGNIAQNSIVDKSRVVRRLDRVEGEDSEFTSLLRSRSQERWHDDNAYEVDIKRCAAHLESPTDREVFHQWLAGHTHEQIAVDLGISPELCRKRWQLIRQRLRTAILQEMHA